MRALLKVAETAGAVLWFSGIVWAQSSDRLYHIVELTDEEVAQIDVKDGSVEDWQQVMGDPTLTAADFRTDPGRGPMIPQIWISVSGWPGIGVPTIST